MVGSEVSGPSTSSGSDHKLVGDVDISEEDSGDWSIFRKLTDPPPEILREEVRRRARLISALLGIAGPISALATLLAFVVRPRPEVIYGFIASGLLLIGYGISRTRYWKVAPWIAVTVALGASVAAAMTDPMVLMFIILSVMVAGMMLSLRETFIVVGIVTLTMVIAFPFIGDTSERALVLYPIMLLMFIIGLTLVQGSVTRWDMNQIQSHRDELDAKVQERTSELRRTTEQLEGRTHDLGERVKELGCLYEMAKLIVDPKSSLEDIFHGTVELIPPAWQYPESTSGWLEIEGKVYHTENHRDSSWVQSSDVLVQGEVIGTLKVGYLEEMPELDEGPFQSEERDLIEAITHFLGQTVEHHRAAEEIAFQTTVLNTLKEVSLDGIFCIDPEGRRLFENDQFLTMWNLERSVIEQWRAEDTRVDVLNALESRLVDPIGVRQWADYLLDQPLSRGRVEIELVDGRTFDSYSAALERPDHPPLGRVWFFRDITDARQSEKERVQLHIARTQLIVQQLIADLVPGLMRTSPGGAQPGMIEFFSSKIDEALGLHYFGDEPAPSPQMVNDTFLQFIRDSGGVAEQVAHNENSITSSISGCPWDNHEKKEVAVCLFCRSIGERFTQRTPGNADMVFGSTMAEGSDSCKLELSFS